MLKEEMPGGEFIVGNFAPLNSLGQEILGRSFLLWFDVFPSFLHQLEVVAGGGGVGVCLCCFKLVSKAILLKSSAFLVSIYALAGVLFS